jgi:TPR repeat protein
MSKAIETIALLTKIMEEEGTTPNEIQKQYTDLYKIINKDFVDSLSTSILIGKANFLKELNDILEKVQLLVTYPALVGKTVIGVVGSDPECVDKILSNILPPAVLKLAAINKNIPLVCLHSADQTLSALNFLETPIALSADEYRRINRELYKDKIDIRNLISAFCLETELNYDHQSLIHFPDYCLKHRPFTVALEHQLDAVFTVFDPKNTKRLNYLEHLSRRISKPIYGVVDEQILEELRRFPRAQSTVILISSSDIKPILESITKPRINYRYSEEVRLKLLDIDVFYKRHLTKLDQRLSTINADLVNIGHDQTNQKIRDIRHKLKNNIDIIHKNYDSLKSESEKLLEKFANIEKLFSSALPKFDGSSQGEISWHNDIDEIWSSLVLRFIDCGNLREAREYSKRLQIRNYRNSYILDLLIAQASNEYFSASHLTKLASDTEDSLLIHKSKIALADALKLSEAELQQIASKIKEPSTAREHHYKALSQEKNNPENAIKYYFKALKMGYVASGEKLYYLSISNSSISLESLAHFMVPIANYELAMSIKEIKYSKAITNLKMAASNRYLPAIKILTDDFYGKLMSKYYKNASEEQMKEKYDNVISLYRYILSKEPGNSDVVEKLGNLFYRLGDFRRSMEYFSKIDTAQALFRCGNMYQYGNGTAQDLHKAKDYLFRAWQKGHSKAKIDYEKACSWSQSNASRSSYSAKSNYSTTSSSYSSRSSSSDSLCFITTATCLALQKPDDCDELMLIRRYRDIMKNEDQNFAILVQEYYRIAPVIIQGIDQNTNSEVIYRELYEKYISKTYVFLTEGDLSSATSTYISMVYRLCTDYKITVSDEIKGIISAWTS